MTLLELLQRFAGRTGVPVPNFVIGNTDRQVIQLLELFNEVLEDVLERFQWTGTLQEAVFTTVAGEDQGELAVLAPNDIQWILNSTIMNRTTGVPLYGPLSASQWQLSKALPTTGPFYNYRVVGGRLKFDPGAVAGHTCAFEYVSGFVVRSEDGTAFRSYPEADTDTFLLNPRILLAGLRWKWKYEKGLEYGEDFRRFEALLVNAKGRDGTKPTLDMGEVSESFRPGIIAPGNIGRIS